MQYSKILPILTGILFGVTLIVSILVGAQITDYNGGSTIFVTALTVSGGVFGSSIIWYMKKAQVENVFKVKSTLYKTISREQINYAEEMLRLQEEYKISKDEIRTLDLDSQLDDLKMSAIMDMTGSLDQAMSDATAPTEIQRY